MEETLKECLRENETVRWQGVQADFSLLDEANRRTILLKWLATALLTAGVLAVYLPGKETPSSGFIGLVALVAVMVVGAPLVERWSLRQQQYWITDQRAILMTRDKSLYSIELKELDGFRVVRDQAAEDCLVLGSCIFPEAEGQLRWRACHPKIDLRSQAGQGEARGMVFYCIRNAAEAGTLLEKSMGVSAA